MARNFKELEAQMSSERIRKTNLRAQRIIAALALDELRQARHMTQENLATVLGVNQAAISKMERRTDMYISTLKSYVQAMGGDLKIEAVFPDGRVSINQFEELDKGTASGK